ncbi:MAG: hypothetical protein ABI992_13415 [Chthoniobacterales bacterium]
MSAGWVGRDLDDALGSTEGFELAALFFHDFAVVAGRFAPVALEVKEDDGAALRALSQVDKIAA